MSEDNWLTISHAVPVRQMTGEGIERFRAYLTNAKAGTSDPLPDELLRDDTQARILDRHVSVEPKSFSTTLEMALYLHPRIEILADARKVLRSRSLGLVDCLLSGHSLSTRRTWLSKSGRDCALHSAAGSKLL